MVGKGRARSRYDYEHTAIEYARWLAQRDGIKIVTESSTRARAIWNGKHVQMVQFWCGSAETEIINIPNWDFEPIEPVEQFNDLAIAA
jgi:hypothetical protein